METIEGLYNTHDFHHWHKLLPQEEHYVSFKPNLIYSMQKADDVYYAFAKARHMFSMIEVKNYGELIAEHDELHLKMIRSNFFMSALNYYNFAIDLSWQVMFFYVSDSSLFFLASPEEYDKYSNKCTYEGLVNNLRYQNKLGLYEISNDFWNKPIVREYRELYNLLKHRGTLHIKGLGEQYSRPLYKIKMDDEDITFNMLVKKEIDLEDEIQKLIEFDKEFYNYFEQVLFSIVPPNYFEVQDTMEKSINFSYKLNEFKKTYLDGYKEKFKEFYE